MPAEQRPNLGLIKAVDRPPVIDMPAAACAGSGVGAIRLEHGVACTGWALVRALSGQNERALVEKAVLRTDQCCHDVDFQVSTAPSTPEIG